ncbi:MAG TPA: ABC transporter substrate-binding protein [Acetobacteraceae bacterium]|nr:ABC transporter substrate-binding protein [Acetobacteraceae bacterium]
MTIDRRSLLTAAGAALVPGFPRGASAAAGKNFVTANNSAYDTLDPHVVFDIGRIATRLNMYDCLVRWVDNPPKLQLWLAEKIDIAPDAVTYTVTLKPGAIFHDGAPVTADDVVFSMERILAMKQGAYGLFKGVVDAGKTRALDARTVQFTLNQPYAVFTSILAELWVVNSKLLRASEKSGDRGAAWLARNEAGSGGFKLHRYDPAIGFQADRFDGHFAGFGQSNISQMEFRVVLETASRSLGLQKGEFNTTDGYLPQDQIRHLRQTDSVQILEAPSLRTMYFIIHNQRPPLDDVNLRRALCYAFDYDGFINNILSGSVSRNAGIIPANLWGAPKDLQGYAYDLDKAKQHLAMVKGPLRPLEIGVLAGFDQSEAAAQLLQAGCAKLGIEVKLNSEPWPVISGKFADKEKMHDLVPLWRSAYFADPHNWTGYMYNSRNIGAGNASFYKNPRFDELTDKALVLTSQAERQPLYEEASRILVDDAAGLFIYNTKWFGPFTKNVQNVRFCPIGDAQDIRWMSMT